MTVKKNKKKQKTSILVQFLNNLYCFIKWRVLNCWTFVINKLFTLLENFLHFCTGLQRKSRTQKI
jgi:hypothetical protein